MSDMGVYTCDECNERFLTQQALASHSQKHKSNSLFTCEECNQTYLTETAYKSHECATNSTNQRELECTNCGAMKRTRSAASRQNGKCYQCGEWTVFEA